MNFRASDADSVLPGLGHNGGPDFEISDATWHVFFDEDGAPMFSPYKVLYGGRGGGCKGTQAIGRAGRPFEPI